MTARKSTPKSLGPIALGGGTQAPVEMEALFTLDGVDYPMYKKVDPRAGLDYAESLANGVDPNVAQVALLKEMLPAETYAILRDRTKVTADEFEAVMDLIGKRALGASQSTKN
ncbi:hypothetical protein ACFUN8_18550 [Streptomyces sp. NPDC057307]|uniref:hypothetical protein n=1 Tax=Streptomyces sp. NPDC057307 TaxID=3346096 RepID=UPI003639E5D9